MMRPISVGVNPTANTLTTLYTVPTGMYAVVTLLHANNATNSNKHVTFDWTDTSAATTISVAYQYTISGKTSFEFGLTNGVFVMEEGDILKVTTETGSTMGIIVTLELEGSQRT
jgi:hypothetical protein